jgi:hypothetical protein
MCKPNPKVKKFLKTIQILWIIFLINDKIWILLPNFLAVFKLVCHFFNISSKNDMGSKCTKNNIYLKGVLDYVLF